MRLFRCGSIGGRKLGLVWLVIGPMIFCGCIKFMRDRQGFINGDVAERSCHSRHAPGSLGPHEPGSSRIAGLFVIDHRQTRKPGDNTGKIGLACLIAGNVPIP